MPARRPLILSAFKHDVHAHAVSWGLRKNGIDPIWASSLEDTAMSTPLSLLCSSDAGLKGAGGPAAREISSVWFRRPAAPSKEFPNALEADQEFLQTEWRRYINNVYAVATEVTDALWVNPPAAATNGENKITQLRAAGKAGLSFPETLMSSDPEQIRRFVDRHERVVYKPFQTHSWQDSATGKIYSTYARIVDAGMLESDASLRQCPGIYQQVVRKQHDVRVTIVGERAFAVRIDSPDRGDFIDWRIGSISETMQASIVELPSGYLDRLQSLMRDMGIVFGCADLAIDAAGEPHFLEINQAGQFLFIEQALPEVPLLHALCALLAQGRTDYSMDALTPLTYKEYVESDEHLEWWDSVKTGIRGDDGAIPGVSVE